MTDGSNRRGVTNALALGVLLAVALIGFSIFQQYGLKESFRLWVQGQEARNAAMAEIVEVAIAEASWRSGGILIVVKTPREVGQTAAEWSAAHKANVDAMLVQFPKDV